MKEKVVEILAQVTNIPAEELMEKADSKDLWESLTNVEIIIALEEEFEVCFEQEEIAEMNSVNKIIEMLDAKLA